MAVGDTLSGRFGEPVEIVGLDYDPTPTVVYNFEVDGTYTYFADGVWVHNKSCQLSFHFHHIVPKYLGGAADGALMLLDPVLHRC